MWMFFSRRVLFFRPKKRVLFFAPFFPHLFSSMIKFFLPFEIFTPADLFLVFCHSGLEGLQWRPGKVPSHAVEGRADAPADWDRGHGQPAAGHERLHQGARRDQQPLRPGLCLRGVRSHQAGAKDFRHPRSAGSAGSAGSVRRAGHRTGKCGADGGSLDGHAGRVLTSTGTRFTVISFDCVESWGIRIRLWRPGSICRKRYGGKTEVWIVWPAVSFLSENPFLIVWSIEHLSDTLIDWALHWSID